MMKIYLLIILSALALVASVGGQRSAALKSTLMKSGFKCPRGVSGYFADPATKCRGFHMCQSIQMPSGRGSSTSMYSMLCSPGTMFDQASLTCTRPNDAIPCDMANKFYHINNNIGIEDSYLLTDNDMFERQKYLQNSHENEGVPIPEYIPPDEDYNTPPRTVVRQRTFSVSEAPRRNRTIVDLKTPPEDLNVRVKNELSLPEIDLKISPVDLKTPPAPRERSRQRQPQNSFRFSNNVDNFPRIPEPLPPQEPSLLPPNFVPSLRPQRQDSFQTNRQSAGSQAPSRRRFSSGQAPAVNPEFNDNNNNKLSFSFNEGLAAPRQNSFTTERRADFSAPHTRIQHNRQEITIQHDVPERPAKPTSNQDRQPQQVRPVAKSENPDFFQQQLPRHFERPLIPVSQRQPVNHIENDKLGVLQPEKTSRRPPLSKAVRFDDEIEQPAEVQRVPENFNTQFNRRIITVAPKDVISGTSASESHFSAKSEASEPRKIVKHVTRKKVFLDSKTSATPTTTTSVEITTEASPTAPATTLHDGTTPQARHAIHENRVVHVHRELIPVSGPRVIKVTGQTTATEQLSTTSSANPFQPSTSSASFSELATPVPVDVPRLDSIDDIRVASPSERSSLFLPHSFFKGASAIPGIYPDDLLE